MRTMTPRYQALRGTRDILPDEVSAWRLLENTTHAVFARYGFREIRTPVFEATELFARSVGSSTDIVRKEMYTFKAGDESVTLRPESTAPVVRAFVEHALYRTIAAGFPERLYYLGPMFRYERPQKGRQRQFHQIGAEVLGSAEPLADAESIEMVWALLDALGIQDRELRLNTVGDAQCRPRFREALMRWLEPRLPSMCEDCRRRAIENPLRVFDCKVDADRKLLEQAPEMQDSLCAPCADHFASVRSTLDAFAIPFVVDARLVRGLDYYQRTVFEVVSGGLGAQNALLGGGRYDGLVHELGGPAIPGFGFAAGMERLVLVMGARGSASVEADLLLVGLGESGFRGSVGLARMLRARGLRVAMPLTERPLGAQMKRAERLGARFALFVGQAELTRGRFGLKDLASGEQIEVDEAGIEAAVRREGKGHDR
jgi:histidyl-tRNA synthetase